LKLQNGGAYTLKQVMKVYSSIDEFAKTGAEKAIVTTGTFDGVHNGHKKILTKVGELAKTNNAESVLLTFDPHPRLVLFGENSDLQLLTTLYEKKELLEKAGVQHLVIHPFTKELSRLSPADYIKEVLVKKLHTFYMVIGHDHRFGKNREGSVRDLKEWAPILGYKVKQLLPLKEDKVPISSTKIREAISEGDLETANKFLGYTYFMNAKVVRGMQLGTDLGYPTANLEVENKYKLIPADGIYAVQAEYEGNLYKGMMSIGLNPTIEGKGRSMEVHIFDFNQDIYHKNLKVLFHKKIRNEEKFRGLPELKAQLDKDKETVLGLLS
jgi:riboflavin kinase/FMN adenylyltransferase